MSLLLINTRIVSMENNTSGCQLYCGGRWQNCPTIQFDQTLECNDKLITPGLIDCHTHLVFAGNRANEFAQRLAAISNYLSCTQ